MALAPVRAQGAVPADGAALERAIAAVAREIEQAKAQLYQTVNSHYGEFVSTAKSTADLNIKVADVARNVQQLLEQVDGVQVRRWHEHGAAWWRWPLTAAARPNSGRLGRAAGGVPRQRRRAGSRGAAPQDPAGHVWHPRRRAAASRLGTASALSALPCVVCEVLTGQRARATFRGVLLPVAARPDPRGRQRPGHWRVCAGGAPRAVHGTRARRRRRGAAHRGSPAHARQQAAAARGPAHTGGGRGGADTPQGKRRRRRDHAHCQGAPDALEPAARANHRLSRPPRRGCPRCACRIG